MHCMPCGPTFDRMSLPSKPYILNMSKTYLIRAMTFGLEVSLPRITAQHAAFASLDTLLVEAMHSVLGVCRRPGHWHLKRRPKLDVLFHNSANLRATHFSDAAYARFGYCADPVLRRLTLRELDLTEKRPTKRTVSQHPAVHPWLRTTTTLVTRPLAASAGRL